MLTKKKIELKSKKKKIVTKNLKKKKIVTKQAHLGTPRKKIPGIATA